MTVKLHVMKGLWNSVIAMFLKNKRLLDYNPKIRESGGGKGYPGQMSLIHCAENCRVQSNERKKRVLMLSVLVKKWQDATRTFKG